MQAQTYPAHWEADVVLTDGTVAQLRPVHPDDGELLHEFFSSLSETTLFLRFFGNHSQQIDGEVQALLASDHDQRTGLVLTIREDIVGVVRYVTLPEYAPEKVAEVAFLVRDDLHGRGIATLLLEHLAEVGREVGIERFVAEMLPENRSMLNVFRNIGYSMTPGRGDGAITVDLAIAETPEARAIMEQRERRSESAAIRSLVSPETVGIFGPGPAVEPLTQALAEAGFTGEVSTAETMTELPSELDLIVVPGSVDAVTVLDDAGTRGCHGLLMMAPPAGPEVSPEEAQRVVHEARSLGVRTLGPAALGLINTDDDVRLNVNLAPLPRKGVVGVFTQSAGVGTIMLAKALSMGLGISTFISTGSYADVTVNDVMHFWSEDDATQVCLLSVDRVGNPRKFFRILRELSRRKPVIVFTPSRALRGARWDNVHSLPSAPAGALDQAIEATGAIVVSQRDEMFDVARLLARQPIPAGRRVRIISNSPGLVDQAAQAANRWELKSVDPHVVADDGDIIGELVSEGRRSLQDPDVDAVMVGMVEVADASRLVTLRDRLEELAAEQLPKPLVGVFVGFEQPPFPTAPDGPGRLPAYSSYADALQAIARAADMDTRRRLPRMDTATEEPLKPAGAARKVVESVLSEAPQGRDATDPEAIAILADYGITLVPTAPVPTLEEALEVAEDLGWDVVLKATARAARGRPDMPNVSRHLGDEDELRRAWENLDRLAQSLDEEDASAIGPVIQPTVQSGIPITIRGIEDQALGPMVSVGVAGPTSELLGDVAWRAVPVSAEDGFAMISGLRSAALLEGYRGSPPAHWFSIVDVLVKLARLKDDLPEVVEVDFTPALAGPDALNIVGARLRIAPALRQRDPLARRAT